MPQQTFFNLPEEKRQQILQVAIDEFAENDYDNASISRIVTRAGIAKGSFYQYFTNKEDLYAHVLGLIAEAKTEFMSLDHPDPNHIGIFAYLRWLTEIGVAFQVRYPQLSKVAVRAANANRFPRSFNLNVRQFSQAFYRRLAEVGQAQGDIAPDVDPQVAAIILEGALTRVSEFMLEKFASGEIVLDLQREDMFHMPEIMAVFTAAVNLLERGMGNRDRQQSGASAGGYTSRTAGVKEAEQNERQRVHGEITQNGMA